MAGMTPKGGGGCGDLATYLAGTVSARALESHRPGPGQPLPSTPEAHCIRPGKYRFSVAGKTFLIDYLQAATDGAGATLLVTNTTASTQEMVEAVAYQDNLPFWDYIVHVDLTSPGPFTDTPVLDIENALTNPKKTTFVNQAAPSGTEQDTFRFSAARSQSSWNLAGSSEPAGRMLARLYLDYDANRSVVTNYYDPRSKLPPLPVIRVHTLGDSVRQSRFVTVALEIMRPDEFPDDPSHVVTRSVYINRLSPIACSSVEALTTWRTTDQYLMASCSARGPEIRYRWQFDAGGPWTTYSPDTLYDFLGHSNPGNHQVSLQVLSTSTNRSSIMTRAITAQSGTVTLNGPTYITDKGTKLYSSSILGQWFERYNPDLRWNPATAYAYTSMTRIWPAGDYTIELRQQDSTLSLIKRGRLHITICHANPAPCQPLSAPAIAGSATSDSFADVFGAGPWMTWRNFGAPQMVRLYDLAGFHDGRTPFADGSWLAQDGSLSNIISGMGLSWRHLDLNLPGVRPVAFELSNTTPSGGLAFGLAVDPDLGSDPADDQTGFDSTLGLVYVWDASRAVGFLLREGSNDALKSVQQFGVGRWSPASPVEAWSAQRTAGVNLISGKRDVQLLLSAAADLTPARYTFVMIQGATPSDVRAKASGAIAVLAANKEP